MPTRIPLILGAASFGTPNTNTTRIHTLPESQAVVDLYMSHGQTNFDAARVYGFGSTEEFLGKLDLHGSTVDTKIYPKPGAFSADNIKAVFEESLKALGPHKIRVYYLHAPDRSKESVSFEESLRAINDLHKAGLIQEFGLSNFFSWEVAEFVAIAKKNDWIRPTVYQGRYNAVERGIETELIPCLRKYGIKFFAYSPLAAGLLSGRTRLTDDRIDYAPGSRFDPKASTMAKGVEARYKPLLPVLRELKDVIDAHGISLSAAAQRWLQHHSALGPEDAVIIGISNINQVDNNIADCEGGRLPADVLSKLDAAAAKSKGLVEYYANL